MRSLSARQVPLALLLALAACAVPPGLRDEAYVGGSASVLPNFGGSLEAGQVFRRTSTLTQAFEIQVTWQPIDDEDLADDGNPSAGDWLQFQGGLKTLWDAGDDRSWTLRYGGVWFRALGEPNIVNERGDYLGIFGGFGFETRLSEHWSMGPELSLMLATREKSGLELDLVPQLDWHLIWSP